MSEALREVSALPRPGWRARLPGLLRPRHALLRPLALGLLLLALLDPQLPGPGQRHDWVIVLDVTQSMDVRDMPVTAADGSTQLISRLQAAKRQLDGLIGELPCGSRLGLGLFTESRSFLLLAPVEVCGNYRELKDTLARIDGRMAWTGNSEVAKGLFGGVAIAAGLPEKPALLFISDGHESPPVNPRYRPNFPGTPGEVRGMVLGVGGDTLAPIPRSDPAGRPLGFWGANEVMQVDPRSLGRGGTGEALVDTEADKPVQPIPGVVPGKEHLSALRGEYLRDLAGGLKLGYQRLGDPAALRELLLDPAMAHPAETRHALAPLLGGAALLALLLSYLPPPSAWRLRAWRRPQR